MLQEVATSFSVGVKATGRVLYFDTNVLRTVNMPFLTNFCGANEVFVSVRLYMNLSRHVIRCTLATKNKYI